MEKFNILKFINNLTSLGERQGAQEAKAARLIIKILKDYKIGYAIQKFSTQIPLVKKAKLSIDGKEIECIGTSFVSGKIESKENIISSLITSRASTDIPNINFNPLSDDISRSNYYFAPALAIKRSDVNAIIKADKIEGEVIVKPKKHESMNILAGNTKNPKKMFFAHYDSFEMGAIDNASGVGALMDVLTSLPESTEDNLFIFSGNEELSYDYPIYWAHGYRAFEKAYKKKMEKAEKIFVIDCVGNGKTNIIQNDYELYLSFPLKEIDKYKKKIYNICGDTSKLMKVYHAKSDNIKGLDIAFLKEASGIVKGLVRKKP
jgi:hypothetical protein